MLAASRLLANCCLTALGLMEKLFNVAFAHLTLIKLGGVQFDAVAELIMCVFTSFNCFKSFFLVFLKFDAPVAT